VEVSDSDGIDATNERLMFEALETHPTIEAVYSVGGGNTAIVAEVEAVGRVCRVFIAHDLDADNRRLPRESRISVVLHNAPTRRRAARDAADPAAARCFAGRAVASSPDPGDHAL
jgi:ABC-type sugar transport system substrate-binding protein